jgi:hypothetical protein
MALDKCPHMTARCPHRTYDCDDLDSQECHYVKSTTSFAVVAYAVLSEIKPGDLSDAQLRLRRKLESFLDKETGS